MEGSVEQERVVEVEDGVEGSVEQGRVEDAAKAAHGHAPKQAALQDAPKVPKQANSAAPADHAIPTYYQVRISKTRYKRLRFNKRIGTHIGTHVGTQIVQCVCDCVRCAQVSVSLCFASCTRVSMSVCLRK